MKNNIFFSFLFILDVVSERIELDNSPSIGIWLISHWTKANNQRESNSVDENTIFSFKVPHSRGRNLEHVHRDYSSLSTIQREIFPKNARHPSKL